MPRITQNLREVVSIGFAHWKTPCTLFALCCVAAIVSPAQTLTTIYSFGGGDGANPYATLVQGTDGRLYGNTEAGGANCTTDAFCGTVFATIPNGTLTTLYSFCQQTNCADGEDPRANLVLDTNGNFYGTTNGGGKRGDGVIFRMTSTGMLSTLYRFCQEPNCTDGANPVAGMVEGTEGNLYGTTRYGGTNNYGTVFEFSPGKLTTLYSFCALANCADGGYPDAQLILAANGNFYGTTRGGGNLGCSTGSGCGTVFEITPQGKLATLYSFCSQTNCPDGSNPEGGLVRASNGNFYGTTWEGGIDQCGGGCGTVFEITPRGKLTTLHTFCEQIGCPDGGFPYAGLLIGTDGNVYGTTFEGGGNNAGTIFQITPTGKLTTLYSFCSQTNCTDGSGPRTGLVQSTGGAIFGTTYYGGFGNCNEGCGTIFSLDMGLSPFVTFILPAGKVSQTGDILGQGFTGTTSVSLNGTPASFTVVSDTFIKATVPAGATTGYVTVTTPSGTLTSNVPFHVIP